MLRAPYRPAGPTAPAENPAGRPRRADRRLLFQSDGDLLQAQVTYPPSGDRAVIDGQLLERLSEPVPDHAVRLRATGRVLAEGSSDTEGRFHLECPLRYPLHLEIAGPDGTLRVRVTLDPGSVE